MAKRKKGYWRQWYRDHRRERIAESIKYQKEHREQRRRYMQVWSERNREHIREYRRKTKTTRNARRRQLYRRDEWRRIKQRQQSKEWQEKNPSKRLAQRLRPFGISVQEYQTILTEQNNKCAICERRRNIDHKRFKRLHLDHNHKTGKVRGLLCSSCNLGLGKFRDDPTIIEKAAMYLRLSHGK